VAIHLEARQFGDFAINAASGIQDKSSPFYTEGELKGRKVKNATKNPHW
jgi:hypothetical protein